VAKTEEPKSTRFSRWRERRREKVAQAREIRQRVKAERDRNMDRHHRSGGDPGGSAGGMGGF
jgi:hypothetical protein